MTCPGVYNLSVVHRCSTFRQPPCAAVLNTNVVRGADGLPGYDACLPQTVIGVFPTMAFATTLIFLEPDWPM